jgi:enoyl reductase-like protein
MEVITLCILSSISSYFTYHITCYCIQEEEENIRDEEKTIDDLKNKIIQIEANTLIQKKEQILLKNKNTLLELKTKNITYPHNVETSISFSEISNVIDSSHSLTSSLKDSLWYDDVDYTQFQKESLLDTTTVN